MIREILAIGLSMTMNGSVMFVKCIVIKTALCIGS